MKYWLKALGGGARGGKLRDDWKNERDGILLRYATFPQLPRMRTGDGIVYYAVGHRVVFAAGTATSLPFKDHEDASPWPFRVKVSLPLALDFVHDGEPLDNIGEKRALRRSIRQHSHIELSEDEYRSAIQALEARSSEVS